MQCICKASDDKELIAFDGTLFQVLELPAAEA